MITSVFCFLSVYIVFGAIVTANYVKNPDLLENDILLYNNDRGQILKGLLFLWIMIVISIIFWILNTNLLLFHIYLLKKGMTTFQYISALETRRVQKREMVMKKVYNNKLNNIGNCKAIGRL